jgi:hypothetical protein
VVRVVLGDNAKPLVIGRDREANTVTFHPAYLAVELACEIGPLTVPPPLPAEEQPATR